MVAQGGVTQDIGELHTRGFEGGEDRGRALLGANGHQSWMVQHRFDFVDAIAVRWRLDPGLMIDLAKIHDVRGEFRRSEIAELRVIGLGKNLDESLTRPIGEAGRLDEPDSSAAQDCGLCS